MLLSSKPAITEQLNTPVSHSFDVIVCGGGPAGIAAAIAAARAGARTMLIEVHGCLGGIWTAGALSWLIDHQNKGGLMREIIDRLKAEGALAKARLSGAYTSAYDIEAMKLLLEQMTQEAGVGVRLHTRVVNAHVNADNRLTHILTESKSGREAWHACVFIDATGDGDLAARSGCRFTVGRPENGEHQPMSLMALISGIDSDAISEYLIEEGEKEDAKKRLCQLLERNGLHPSYRFPTLFRIHDGLFALMANHEYNYSATDADQVTRATLNARKEINAIIRTLQKSAPQWRSVFLVATAAQIGVRESRRIAGHSTVTRADMESGKRHTDSICEVTFCADIHATNKSGHKGYTNEGVIHQPYQIPLGAAIAADVDGLMLAGRCISGDFFAHSSYRVTGNAVQIGESVGRAAAMAASRQLLPHQLLGAPHTPFSSAH